MKLVRLIEAHSEALSQGLAEQLQASERTSDFRQISREDLQRRALELYRNLGEWLLQKTENEIANRFKMIAQLRSAEGIHLHQYIWALTLTRDYLWRFLRQQAFADSIFDLHGELEVLQLLNQFFDRAIYYAILSYEEAVSTAVRKDDWTRAREAAVSIGLLSH
ncbi:MAG TPA: hypothetical protein VJ453_13585 [Terriglobales bacterium]|nr:hypothetical protein [Terriglobales bacterium]